VSGNLVGIHETFGPHGCERDLPSYELEYPNTSYRARKRPAELPGWEPDRPRHLSVQPSNGTGLSLEPGQE
jgi:hypothetical protein